MGEADTAIPVDAAAAVESNKPIEAQSLFAKLAQAGSAWEDSAPSLVPGVEAKQLQHILRFVSETGIKAYGRAYNVDAEKALIIEIAENMDWEALTPEVLADETIANDYRLAKILLENAQGFFNDDDYPGYLSKAEFSEGIFKAGALLGRFKKQPQAV